MSELNNRFIAHLESGGIVLTANRRQARIIRRLHDQAQVAAGRPCWTTAEVLPLDAWMSARWQELAAADASLPTLLSEAQASWPWRRSAEAFVDPTLIALPDLAQAARHAWLQLTRHGSALAALDAEVLTRDQSLFRRWAGQVEASLAMRGWLDPGQLDIALAASAVALSPQGPLLLAGFDRPAPATSQLMQRLAACGTRVEWAPAGDNPGRSSQHAAADPEAELRAWLGWARRRLETDPATRLAVIVPDLQSRRAALERALEEVLQPELELPGGREHDRIYDLAGGTPLAGLSVAQAALDCLDCGRPRLDLGRFSRLLRTRYIGVADDPEILVRFELALRDKGLADWPITALSRRAGLAGCGGLAQALEATRQLLQGSSGRRAPDEWAGLFGKMLATWGWPGRTALASDEFQAAQALRDRLRVLADLTRAAPDLTLDEARTEFRRIASAPFQPERGLASLWVLDALDPPGVAFDGLWVSGMTAGCWPPAARHEPFLPVALQRRLGIPGVTAEDTLAQAQRTVEAWQASAPEVVFSWPMHQDDASVEASRIVPAGLPTCDSALPCRTRATSLLGSTPMEILEDDPVPPLVGVARGGSRILELQAKCPFRAYAELRLASRPLQEPAAGVDARVRGIVLHRTLELLWQELGRRSALDEMHAEELTARIDAALDRAIAEVLPPELGPCAAGLEREWQRLAIVAALDLDRSRADFEVVATEGSLEATLAGLSLNLRVDRIDKVGDRRVVLDYKTGRAATSQWRGSRPDSPQLPLYAVLGGQTVGGVAFVALGAGTAACKGVGAVEQLLPGMEPAERYRLTDDQQTGFAWDEVLQHWAGWLTQLAEDHRDGIAVVDPKLPGTCRFCHLQTLCRVAPGYETQDGDQDGD